MRERERLRNKMRGSKEVVVVVELAGEEERKECDCLQERKEVVRKSGD